MGNNPPRGRYPLRALSRFDQTSTGSSHEKRKLLARVEHQALHGGMEKTPGRHMYALAPRLGTRQFASRLKNNLLPSAEIGFVSPWGFMQAINC